MPVQGDQLLDATLADELELDRITFDPATDTPRFAHRALSVRAFGQVQWPAGLEPQPHKVDAKPEDPMPQADLLIVTYTVAEGYALADVLTPGVHSTEWVADKNSWDDIEKLIEGDRAPSLKSKCSGYWWVTQIGTLTAVVMKSELHPATDGVKLPIVTAWQKWVSQVQPKLVITTGTAGAVQSDTFLGDVIVTNSVSWDCTGRFKTQPFAGQSYTSPMNIEDAWFDVALPLIDVNATQLPAPKRKPKVWTQAQTISTDSFAFDDVDDRYGLRKFNPNARAVEMDDAACAQALAYEKTPWLSVRNASDPQMDDPTLAQEAKLAAAIYNRYGQVTSWGSALACWAIAVALGGPAT
jgi:nucleoside phosphorylase